MSSVAMTRASDLCAVISILERQEGRHAVGGALTNQGLPVSAANDPDAFVPQRAVVGLYEAVARILGMENIGAFAAREIGFADLGFCGRYAVQAPTLGEALQRAVSLLRVHESGSYAMIRPQGDAVSVSYQSSQSDVVGWRHVADKAVIVAIDLIRGYLGTRWMPLRIEVDYPAPGRIGALETLFDTTVRYDCDRITIVLERACLGQPNLRRFSAAELLTLEDLHRLTVPFAPSDPASAILQIIRLRLLDGHTDVEGAAEMLCVSVRTLQRLLKRQGTSYRHLLGQARNARAKALLEETRLPISEIALQLGYSSQAHFSRAFQKWAGKPPGAVRRADSIIWVHEAASLEQPGAA